MPTPEDPAAIAFAPGEKVLIEAKVRLAHGDERYVEVAEDPPRRWQQFWVALRHIRPFSR